MRLMLDNPIVLQQEQAEISAAASQENGDDNSDNRDNNKDKAIPNILHFVLVEVNKG